MCLVMAGVSAAAFAMLAPSGESVGNSEIVKWMNIGAWAVGPVMAIPSIIGIGILNLLRRLFRIRRVEVFHPIVVLIGVVPWFVFAWILSEEPPFTPIARAVVEFLTRPMLWGSLVAILLTILLSIPLLLPKKK